MVRLSDLDENLRAIIETYPASTFDAPAMVDGPPLYERRVAIVSTAGLHCRDDRPFDFMSSDYRIIPGDVTANDLVMSHISVNFDRTGFSQDLNTVFPIDRLREMAAEGSIAGLADYHYSFMGATDAESMEPAARNLAGLFRKDNVTAILLVPV